MKDLNTEKNKQKQTLSRENILYIYLKADSTSSESLQRNRNTKSLTSQSSDLMFPPSELQPTRTRRPETSQTSYRVECRQQIPVH